MAIPSSGYDLFTISNPSSALTDFVLYIDLANTSADFKAAWDTSSNGMGRAYKEDNTELPTDWICLDHSAKTGCVMIKYTGSLASSGTQKIKLYPPRSVNPAYSRTSTYGQNAVWSDAIAIYPLRGDATERSGKAYDLTVSGAVAQAGGGYSFDGVNDYLSESGTTTLGSAFAGGYTMTSTITPSSFGEGGFGRIVDKTNVLYFVSQTSSNLYASAGGFLYVQSDSNSVTATVKLYGAVTVDTSSVVTHYVNGSISGTPGSTTNIALASDDAIYIGNNAAGSRSFAGIIHCVCIWAGVKSAVWVAEAYAQEIDNATFWGTPEWIEPSVTSKKVNYFYEFLLKGDE